MRILTTLLIVLALPAFAKKDIDWKTGKIIELTTVHAEVIAGATTRTESTGTAAGGVGWMGRAGR